MQRELSQEGREGEEGRAEPVFALRDYAVVYAMLREAAQIPEKFGTQAALLRKKIKTVSLQFPSKATQPKLLVCEANKRFVLHNIDFFPSSPSRPYCEISSLVTA